MHKVLFLGQSKLIKFPHTSIHEYTSISVLSNVILYVYTYVYYKRNIITPNAPLFRDNI